MDGLYRKQTAFLLLLTMTDTIPEIAPMFRFQWEDAQQCYVILYPEGMVKLSQSAGEIMKRCDGEKDTKAIICDLETTFPGADLKDDVQQFLKQAKENGWIEFKSK